MARDQIGSYPIQLTYNGSGVNTYTPGYDARRRGSRLCRFRTSVSGVVASAGWSYLHHFAKEFRPRVYGIN